VQKEGENAGRRGEEEKEKEEEEEEEQESNATAGNASEETGNVKRGGGERSASSGDPRV